MCDCRQRLEASVSEQVANKYPYYEVKPKATLQGYAMVFSGPVPSKQYMAAEVTYQQPSKAKKGQPSRMIDKKTTVNIMANFCMFCGEKYPTGEEGEPSEG